MSSRLESYVQQHYSGNSLDTWTFCALNQLHGKSSLSRPKGNIITGRDSMAALTRTLLLSGRWHQHCIYCVFPLCQESLIIYLQNPPTDGCITLVMYLLFVYTVSRVTCHLVWGSGRQLLTLLKWSGILGLCSWVNPALATRVVSNPQLLCWCGLSMEKSTHQYTCHVFL